MSAKSDVDRLLQTLESYKAIVPATVRQLLVSLAKRCDELEKLVTRPTKLYSSDPGGHCRVCMGICKGHGLDQTLGHDRHSQ